MNNQNRNNQNNQNNGANPTPANNTPAPAESKEKKTITQRILTIRDKVMGSKAGRIAVHGLKAIGVGGIGFACYKAGVKSVKPTVVYVHEGVKEEPEEESKETVDEETGEIIKDE